MDTSPRLQHGEPARLLRRLRSAHGPRGIEPDAAPGAMTGPDGADCNPAHQSAAVRRRRDGMVLLPSGAGLAQDGCRR